MTSKRGKKKGQITIFIIIAIIIVALIVGFFLFKDKIFTRGLPGKFQPIESQFLDCVKETAENGKEIMSQQAGYIQLPEFEPGSNYAPFSSQLNFNGVSVPYWYYVSGNNIVKEQMPSKQKMQNQLSKYIEDNLECDFSNFEGQGYEINFTKPEVIIKINSGSIDISINSRLNIARESESAFQSGHETQIKTNLGKFYDDAVKIYSEEKKSAFFELYAVDVLRLYAPVDGVELSCAPKVWMPQNVAGDIYDALEANMPAIKFEGNYYSKADKYFVTGVKVDSAVNILYNKNWPRRLEIWPVDGAMIAQPVGNQEGMGILGFCYVPYHFVYDLMFPVLVQVTDGNEIFQFPVGVIVSKNKPREALEGEAVSGEVELCKYKNSDATVYTYDTKLAGVEAEIAYKCFDAECEIGKTEMIGESAVLSAKFPQCVNGFIIARAKGFAEKKYMFSTNQPGSAEIILDKLYNLSVDIDTSASGILYFSGENSVSLAWPQQKMMQLAPGLYNISLQLFTNSSLVFPASTKTQCVEVQKPGLLGFFGSKEEKCFDINMPSQSLTSVLIGGGTTSEFFTEESLEKGKIKITFDALKTPRSLEELQKNYEDIETKKVYITYE